MHERGSDRPTAYDQRPTTDAYGLTAIKSGLQGTANPTQRPAFKVEGSLGNGSYWMSPAFCVSMTWTWPSDAAIYMKFPSEVSDAWSGMASPASGIADEV